MRGLWRIRPGVELEVDILGHDKPWGVHRLEIQVIGGHGRVWVNADKVGVERVTSDGLGYVPWDAREEGYR